MEASDLEANPSVWDAMPVASDFADVDLPPLPELPGMISNAERRFLFWLTSTRYTGRGAIVEVGPWLGRSTVHLAAGLERSGHPGRITSIDRFVWTGADFEKKAPLNLARGADFQPFFERNVAPFRDRIVPVKSTLESFAWRDGWIEILFVDAPKRTGAISRFFANFAPSLLPEAKLVFQDYLHGPSYQLPVAISHLRHCLEPVHVVQPGGSVAFRLKRPIYPEEVTEEALGFEGWSEADAKARWQEIVALLPEATVAKMSIGLPMLLYDLGHTNAACAALADIADHPVLETRLKRWAATSLGKRYHELFVSLGLGMDVTSQPKGPSERRRAKKKSKRPKMRKRLKRLAAKLLPFAS